MLIADVAIADILFLSFYYFVVHQTIRDMSERETFWYRVSRILFRKNNLYPLLPSGGVFGIAWLFLYFLIAIAGYIVWLDLWYDFSKVQDLNESQERRFILLQSTFVAFFVNIWLNKYWTVFFFRSKQYLIGLIDIGLLFVSSVYIIVIYFVYEFYVSAAFFCAYALWLAFAFYLNWVFYTERKFVDDVWNKLVQGEPEHRIYKDDDEINTDVYMVTMSKKKKKTKVNKV